MEATTPAAAAATDESSRGEKGGNAGGGEGGASGRAVGSKAAPQGGSGSNDAKRQRVDATMIRKGPRGGTAAVKDAAAVQITAESLVAAAARQ